MGEVYFEVKMIFVKLKRVYMFSKGLDVILFNGKKMVLLFKGKKIMGRKVLVKIIDM